jgi:hypothetical protein
MIYIRSITIDDNKNIIKIIGGTTSSIATYIGTINKQDGNTLNIGIKYNKILGFLERKGDFDIRIIINTNSIEKIIIKGNQEDETIYEKGGPQSE